MTTQHTPGPWRLEPWSYDNGRRIIPTIRNDKDAIAQTLDLWCMDDRQAEAQANARLIVAAPDLLQGCLAALAYLADPPSQFPENRATAADIIRAAITKAEGLGQ